MVVPCPAGTRVAVNVVITSSSFTGSGKGDGSSSFEQDTYNNVVKRIVANKFNFLIFCDFKLIIVFDI